ncbi:hypothetical protein Nepgr_030706 [Nepenthes gracilis]|uniref:Uncharacterized protein n=1 Tax=Nepenthes gracilis TaxID=150966 RepID=A0AAD3TFA2_NEPGR|nr:hypothetical protein Nepgr_030706 [Nepenthes gracilis]
MPRSSHMEDSDSGTFLALPLFPATERSLSLSLGRSRAPSGLLMLYDRLFLEVGEYFLAYMRGTASILQRNNICKRSFPIQGSWGGIAPSLELKNKDYKDTKEGTMVTGEKADPLVAFSRPPPLPPSFLGSLVALSLLETNSDLL